MLKIILSIIFFSALSLATLPVLKTGQINSYNADGNLVINGNLKDDGYYRAGNTRSYTRSGAGTVNDNVTGLEWQDNTNSVRKDWNEAQNYCNNLYLEGSGWRLPAIEELESIIDFGQKDPSVTNAVFQNIAGDGYWSSTTHEDNASYAWVVGFYDGNSNYNEKTENKNVICVRGESSGSNYFRDSDKNIVIDNETDLVWQDDEWSVYTVKTWQEAITYCEELSLGGYNDWRLPNIKEMLSIVDRSKTEVMMNDIFQNVNSVAYWTSTTSVDNTSDAWLINFYGSISSGGASSISVKTFDGFNVRCVRGGEVASPENDTKIFGFIPIVNYLLF